LPFRLSKAAHRPEVANRSRQLGAPTNAVSAWLHNEAIRTDTVRREECHGHRVAEIIFAARGKTHTVSTNPQQKCSRPSGGASRKKQFAQIIPLPILPTA
jgi:hypothetical protein